MYAFHEKVETPALIMDPETEEIKGISLTIISPDGTKREEVIPLESVTDVTDEAGNYLYTQEVYRKSNWGGIEGVEAVKELKYIKRKFSTSVKGKVISEPLRLYKDEKFITLSIPIQTVEVTPVEEDINKASDVNQDGVVGPSQNEEQAPPA
jgi:hypothetical protein